MKIFKKIFILTAAILILNFTVVSAEEEYVPPEVQEIFDEIDKLSETKELAKKNMDLIDKLTYKIPQQYPDDKIILRKVYNILGSAYAMAERYDFAKKYLNLSYQINPNHPFCYFWFGLVENELKNYDQSIKYYEKAIQIYTDDENKSDCENNIGVNYAEQKNFSEAIKHYTASINYFPTALTYKKSSFVSNCLLLQRIEKLYCGC